MVANDEINASLDCLIDDHRYRIDGEQHRLDPLFRITADQTNPIPGRRKLWRVQRFERADNLGQAWENRCSHRSRLAKMAHASRYWRSLA